MTRFLITKFIPAGLSRKRVSEEGESGVLRFRDERKLDASYEALGGAIGIVCNCILFILKLITGLLTGAIAMIVDAFNNLGDVGTSAVTALDAGLRIRKIDRRNAYSHGSAEYISYTAISFVSIGAGIVMLLLSVRRIVDPGNVKLNIPALVIFAVSALLKLWMYFSYRYLGKLSGSGRLHYSTGDCIRDIAATMLAAAALPVTVYTKIPADGIIGALISTLLIVAGFVVIRDMLRRFLGSRTDEDTAGMIEKLILSGEGVTGCRDLTVWDYGPGRVFASAYAEVADTEAMDQVMPVLASIEQAAWDETGVELSLRPDPVRNYAGRLASLKAKAVSVIDGLDAGISADNFSFTEGKNGVNLKFSLHIPEEDPVKREAFIDRITAGMTNADSRVKCEISVYQ